MMHPVIYTSDRSISYDAVGGTGFEVPFPVFDWADIKVYLDGVLQSGWQGSAITCGSTDTGRVTFAEPVSGQVSIISRRMPRRTHDYVEGAGLHVGAINTDFDRLTATDQELYRDLRSAEAAIAAEEQERKAKDAAEEQERKAKDAAHDAQFLKTFRVNKNLNVIPVGCDNTILSWLNGQVVNQTADQLIVRRLSIGQDRPSPLSLCDIQDGIFFGCPPAPIQPWNCYDLAEPKDWPEGTEPCAVLAEPATLQCMGQITTALGPHVRSVYCPDDPAEPFQLCIYTTIKEAISKRCCT